MKKVVYAAVSIIFIMNLAFTFLLYNEIVALKKQSRYETDYLTPIVLNVDKTELLPMRIEIKYTDIDGTERFIRTYDNMIETGNADVDNAITLYMKHQRQTYLICNCDRPNFNVTETKDGIRVMIKWQEYVTFLPTIKY